MACLVLECLDNTEMMVHDNSHGYYSFMRYTNNGNFRIGRNMGWGSANVTFSNNVSIDNELLVSGNKLVITGISPPLYLRDTNGRSGMIHMNDNVMYFLSGVANSDTWSQVNSQWSLTLNTNINETLFGGMVYINDGNTDNGSAKLLVAGSDSNSCSVLFYHPNRSQGIGIVYDGLRGLSPSGNQSISMTPLGTGMFVVNSSSYSVVGSGGYYDSRGYGYETNNVTWYNICAKFNGGVWSTSYFLASSDSRIKEDIQDINDDDALNKLLAIEPKTYKHIHKIAKGNSRVYGFIAQQIREVIPEAVKIEKSYIPNIMLIGDFDDYIITLPSQPEKVIIKVDDKIRCIDDKGEDVLVKVEEVIDELTFKIKAIDDMKPLEYTHDKIFIHGTEVEDFHTLTKEYIFTLNVCVTQELHRRMEAQNVIIKSQDERIKELEIKIEKLVNYIS